MCFAPLRATRHEIIGLNQGDNFINSIAEMNVTNGGPEGAKNSRPQASQRKHVLVYLFTLLTL